jgi:hypothetical protein
MTKLVERDATHIVEEDGITPPPHYDEANGPQVLTPDTARQAPKGVPVLWVLIGGLVLIGVAWAAVSLFAH